ncbi:MAG: DEAD/DEAH box helicase [Proteobacteria bacterium]|nr:DEAD/DEAH box helicase [Pseudomonadota bacterium]MBU1059522.1 DEAD/DEAH box helicase [Pseudomonadota bacterium]
MKRLPPSTQEGSVPEYLQALKGSRKYGPQVVCHKSFPEENARVLSLSSNLSQKLTSCLHHFGISDLYEHQARALELVQEGKDFLTATPTASGKSMIYNLPMLEAILADNEARGLYLFPLKALAQDQFRVLRQFEDFLAREKMGPQVPLAAIYDGDTSAWQRKKIRANLPNILITNPDMLHLSLLPYHATWRIFFQQLRYIVIDEVHTYRGVFGSHMAWVLRRLQRILALYGARPTFILLSATIGNPGELGQMLIGRPVVAITRSGAPRAKRHMLFLNPWDSAAHTASQLLEAALKRGLRTIVYTQSRKMTELITMWTRPRLGELAEKVRSYRSGFLPEERRDIEQKLSQGDLLGVISTSALELGIDIGDLDLCLLVGYPGSIMASWQRGGRVGRGMRESAVVLIAQEDALDQYFMRNPEDFFKREMESAVLNPLNPEIMAKHLHCAAAELTLTQKEVNGWQSQVILTVKSLTEQGTLLQSSNGEEWFATRKFPQRLVHLRGGGKRLQIIREESGEILGEIDSQRALKECHPGAVYLHSATTWLVKKADLESQEVLVTPFTGSYYTRPMSEKHTEILEVFERKIFRGYGVSLGRLLVREQVTGYQKKNKGSNKLIATLVLELPEQSFETVGLWLEIPGVTQVEMEEKHLHFMGAIHALEHAMIGMFPLLILCDRNDIGGISCPVHHQTAGAAVFIYDGYPGGIGLCTEAFSRIDELLVQTDKTVAACGCETGCPSCVHSPKCGSGNRPIDKAACLVLAKLLRAPGEERFVGQGFKEILPRDTEEAEQNMTCPGRTPELFATSADILSLLPPHFGVFDLETKYSAEEVGGWHNAHKMGISVAVVYDSKLDDFVTYLEEETDRLLDHLNRLELVIGFNNRRFDNRVLAGYTSLDLSEMPLLDLLEVVQQRLGYRLSLDRLAQHTLGTKKSADGLQALKWYREGEIEKICRYCRKDVAITRDLLFHGLEYGYFLFQNKAGKVVRLPVDLGREIAAALKI